MHRPLDPARRLIVPNPKHALRRLDISRAPAGQKRACESRIEKADRQESFNTPRLPEAVSAASVITPRADYLMAKSKVF